MHRGQAGRLVDAAGVEGLEHERGVDGERGGAAATARVSAATAGRAGGGGDDGQRRQSGCSDAKPAGGHRHAVPTFVWRGPLPRGPQVVDDLGRERRCLRSRCLGFSGAAFQGWMEPDLRSSGSCLDATCLPVPNNATSCLTTLNRAV
uniref:Uncharacterized protein n=1 Tax=Verrucosispora sp. MS100047 TaxID=1410949 RepID=A0A097CTD5_9ACTN|nr:hypothetical protein VASRM7_679 [Verrucosispora sp. MS100047]